MASIIIGAVVKYATGSAIAGYIASYAVSALLASGQDGTHTYGSRLGVSKVQSSTEGAPIKKVYGTDRIAGNVIWSGGIKETSHTQESGGGKGGAPSNSHTTYTYDASFAIALGEGEIVGVRRIWADNNLIYSKSDTATADELAVSDQAGITVFTGTENQMASSTIEAVEGVGNVPAFRGLAYLLFDNFQLENYGNRIPTFTCEVVASGSYTGYTRVTPIVKAPGTWGQIRNTYGISGSSVLFIDPVWNASTSILQVRERAMDTAGIITEAGITFDHFVGDLSFFDKNGLPTYIPLGMRPGYYSLPLAPSINGYWWQGSALYEAGNPVPIYETPLTQDVHGGAGYSTTYWGFGGGYYWYHYLANNNVNTPVYKRVHVASGIAMNYDAPNVIDPNTNVESSRLFCDDNYTYFTGSNNIDGGDTGRIFRYAIDGTTPLDFIKTPSHPSKLWLDYNNPGVIYFPVGSQVGYISFEDPVVRTMPQQSGLSYERLRQTGSYFVNEYMFLSGDSAYRWVSYSSSIDPGNWEMHSKYLQIDTSNLADIITDLCAECRLSSSDIDVTDLTSITVRGFTRANPSNVKSLLRTFIDAYSLTVSEVDYKLVFEQKHGSYDLLVPESDLAASSSRGEASDRLKITRAQEVELPRRIEVIYPDFNGDYQDGNQFAQRIKS